MRARAGLAAALLLGCVAPRAPLRELRPPSNGRCAVRHDALPTPVRLRAPLDALIIEEDFALQRPVPATWIYGADLAKARELLERWAVFPDARAQREIVDSGVLDGSSVTLRARFEDGVEQRVTLTNCAERNVCMFLRDAYEARLVARLPDTCDRNHLASFAGDRCVEHDTDPSCLERHLLSPEVLPALTQ